MLKFFCGFGWCAAGAHVFGTAKDLLAKFVSWTGTVTVTELASEAYGRRCYVTMASGTVLKTKPLGDLTTFTFGARFYVTQAGHTVLCRFFDGATRLGALILRDDGVVLYSRQADLNNIVVTSSITMNRSEWTYVEVTLVLHNTTGEAHLFINKTAAGSATGVDTLDGSATKLTLVEFGGPTEAGGDPTWHSGTRVTDIYVDSATQHGAVEAWYRAGNAAGSAAGFTPSAGSNHENVDDLGNDGDTTYNRSTVADTLDQIAISGTIPQPPIAVQALAIARYEGPGSASLRLGVLSGAVHSQGASQGLSDTYAGLQDDQIHEVDPNTGVAWTGPNADAAEVSYQHKA